MDEDLATFLAILESSSFAISGLLFRVKLPPTATLPLFLPFRIEFDWNVHQSSELPQWSAGVGSVGSLSDPTLLLFKMFHCMRVQPSAIDLIQNLVKTTRLRVACSPKELDTEDTLVNPIGSR